jgi:hypothetical protein
MSKAGIQSNRGDGYQTLVAFDWALSVLADPEYQWIEVDSVTRAVDDVVVGKVDGTTICCQCKKNQAEFKAWTVYDLQDELIKAVSLLVNDPHSLVCFYSRSAFGEIAALREFSLNYDDESSYRANLGKSHSRADSALRDLLSKQTKALSIYDFLRRTEFVVTDELDRMQMHLRTRLRQLVSNPSAAFDALWTHLDHLGMRLGAGSMPVAAQYRLTKDELKSIIARAGAILTPPRDKEMLRNSFAGTSSIGRAWRREVGGVRLSNPVVDEILSVIGGDVRSILVTGLPGSGKTCVMLDLQEKLEERAKTRHDLLPLFIQTREFADLGTTQDRQAQGLAEQWVEGLALLAEDVRVIVVIDSLDVLSIAREHKVLDYFLAQIDRLLLIPNVTVITACRDFDRRYDRRIEQRTWDREFSCRLLDWDADIAPLLAALEIDTSRIDSTTRELIRNPRELALFVELAERYGSFNVVTTEALATQYLATFVQRNNTMGDAAMQAIEAIAADMLKSRSLAVPRQRFAASQDVERALLSQNVLHETQDGKLTFGHQTLLDVLVVSGAIRRGVTLNEFIRELPPVPFVRPSIRGFIAQLSTGDRRTLRKQLRTVLLGGSAFHIRRLVAETFAEQAPKDDDWSLIRDLRTEHRDVFNVIYTHATQIEWHHFWLKHLVPVLKDGRDSEGIAAHAYRVHQWKNHDIAGVVSFWSEVLTLDWTDRPQIAMQLEFALSDVDQGQSAQLAPLLLKLLDMPRQDHSFLGAAIARCIEAGGLDDSVLWRYIAGAVSDEDVLAHNFSDKLRSQPHEFNRGDHGFLVDRMKGSSPLLDQAITSIEHWGEVMRIQFGGAQSGYWWGLLHRTSYIDAHSQTDHRHLDSERVLLDAVEAGIVHNAHVKSEWWETNRERLCFSAEGALRYFSLLACRADPEENLEVIAKMFRDKALFESDLSYEVGTLMHAAMVHLDFADREPVEQNILALYGGTASESTSEPWVLKARAQLAAMIPCHLRSGAMQSLINECEKAIWPLVPQPEIRMQGGMVSAPFSFDVFLTATDEAVLLLLSHYNGHTGHSSIDFLSGGAREVGWQLREAASRNPTRFLAILREKWAHVADRFCDDIMDGVATYLAHRHGNLQVNGNWSPIEEPDAAFLASEILDELERHTCHWNRNRAGSSALRSCSQVVVDTGEAARLVFLAIGFAALREESSISGERIDLITIGINMARGHASEALMILTNRFAELDCARPELLIPTLRRFASDEHPAIRALILQRLAYLQSREPELGWELFDAAMHNDTNGLWSVAEPCFYYSYHQNFDRIASRLERLVREGTGDDLATWGRISALASLSGQIDHREFISQIALLANSEAWHGAASVWTHCGNAQRNRQLCLTGLEAGLRSDNPCAVTIARELPGLFRDSETFVSIPPQLLRRFFNILSLEPESSRRDVFGFDDWLNALAIRDPLSALAATEMYLDFSKHANNYLYDHNNNLTQLLTRLFAQAEEQEETDGGEMLRRVVLVQDTLLTLGVKGVTDWLKAAERAQN